MSCKTCGAERHLSTDNILAFHRLADRIAKLEACDCAHGPGCRLGVRIRGATQISAAAETATRTVGNMTSSLTDNASPRAARETTPAAAGPIPPGYALAPGWRTVVPPSVLGGPLSCVAKGCFAAAVYYGGNGACAAHAEEMGAIVKVEPPMAKPVHRSGTHFAEQPVSAANEVLCAPECRSNKRSGAACDCGKPRSAAELIERLDEYAAKQPPAPAQGAPAEPRKPLSARIDKYLSHWFDEGTRSAIRYDIAALETRLADAERERDELKQAVITTAQTGADAAATAVAAERERCLWWASNHTWPVHRDAIRDGRPAK